jgi:hypothetical protein
MIESVQNLITKELEDIYNNEMKKAQPILDFLKYVYDGIKYYQKVYL